MSGLTGKSDDEDDGGYVDYDYDDNIGGINNKTMIAIKQ